ncbi:hypothetical protein FO519_002807 [Halicephalobus sp. NKZ332]|nr:hypothetical protein FO519_002807 [Halicephalobus sp. NKZ332]
MRVLGQEHRSQSLANSLNYFGNYQLNVIPEESVYLTIEEGSENGLDQADEGTESLDRRYWQAKPFKVGLHGSAHDVMISSAPGPQYYVSFLRFPLP